MILSLIRHIALCCTILIPTIPAIASELNFSQDWLLVKDKQDIQVYTQAVEDSVILKVKTQVIINSTIQEIQALLDNAAYRRNWIPYLKHSSVHHHYSNMERLEYSHFSAPWPAYDRDFVYRIQLIHEDRNQLVYQMKSVHSTDIPEKDDIIRAELIESSYTLTALSKYQTKVELVFHADPRGWLPTWIINIIQKTLPYLILRNLREQFHEKQIGEW